MTMGDPDVDALLDQLWNAGGTDLLLTAGTTPLLRVNGELTPADGYPLLTAEDTASMADALLNDPQRETQRAIRPHLRPGNQYGSATLIGARKVSFLI